MDLLKGKKILVLDTEYETNPKRLLSLSYLIINGTDTMSITDYIHHSEDVFIVNEKSESFKYHKLTNTFLKENGISINNAIKKFIEFIDGIDIIVGQNIISADISAIRREAIGCGLWFGNLREKIKKLTIYDTMFAFREKNPGERSSLDKIYKFLFDKDMTNHHDASYDCQVTFECFKKMLTTEYSFKCEKTKFAEDTFEVLMKECIKCEICDIKISSDDNSFKYKTNMYIKDNIKHILLVDFLKKDDNVCLRCMKKMELLVMVNKDMKNLLKLKSYENMISCFFDIIGEEPIIVYLESQYKDKDIIRKLGGKWHGQKKKWYFTYTSKTEDIINKFTQWIPIDE